jgi:CRP/FNR family transcriptional regulator, cyclic AMP receptor protein
LRWLESRTAAGVTREVVVDAALVPRGLWEPGELRAKDQPPPTALVVLDGYLIHTVSVHGRLGSELVGPGDVLCPWSADADLECLPRRERWRVLEPLELAVLDRRFEAIAARLPGVMSELIRRQGRQARALATHRALLQVPGLGNRLLLMLWCLAERWGRVLPDRRLLPLRLTHGTLAELVGAQRPSVTLALQELERAGRVSRDQRGGWIVAGAPPAALDRVDSESRLAATITAYGLLVASLIAAPLADAVDASPLG